MPNREVIDKNLTTIMLHVDPKYSSEVAEALNSILSEFEGDFQRTLKDVNSLMKYNSPKE